jgi:predicted ATPase/DNA-binding SARP family transcriptional activator
VPLAGSRQLKLFAFLLLNANRAVSADALIDAVWGAERNGAVKRLQMAIARLRKALAPLDNEDGSILRTVSGGYLLAVGGGELDSEVFAERVEDARRVLEHDDPARASRLLTEALDLWRGPPLADVAFEEFAQADIRRLKEQRLVALETRIEADLAAGRHRELIGELEALAMQEPSREGLAGQLMVALYRSGRQTQALEVYQRTRAHLAEELGLDPGPRLRSLQLQILAQEQELDGGVAASGEITLAGGPATLAAADLRAEPVTPSQIPLAPTETIGRDAEVAAVVRMLREPAVRLVTLTGPGGVGKTRLAQVVAHFVEPEIPDGAHWVELAAVARSGDVAFTLAQELGVSVAPGENLDVALRRFLAVRRLLLVLDNFEHVVDAGPLIADLLASCAGLVVLATSRVALDLRAEHRFVVAPLSVPLRPEEATPEEIAATNATALFVAVAKRQDHRFDVTRSDAPAIARICSQLDGLPLALELAAARTALLSVEDLEARLRQTFAELGAGPRDAPARHRTLGATIEWSYNLLGGRSQEAFVRFAVFAGGATAEVAEAVTGAGAETWEALVAKSLLDARREPDGSTRLFMLESVRQVVNERLAGSDTHGDVRRLHCRYYLAAVERAVQGFSGSRELDSVRAIDLEINNIRAAAGWALREDPVLALRMVGHLEHYWWIREDPDALRWLDDAMAAVGGAAPPEDLALAHLGRSMELTRQRQPPDFGAATEAAEAARRTYIGIGDHAGAAEAYISLVRLAGLSGSHSASPTDVESGRRLAEEACRHAGLSGDGVLLGKALGRLALWLPESERAPIVSEAGELLVAGGHRRELANVYCNAGYVAVEDGNAEEAIKLLEQALSAAESIDYPYLIMIAHGNLGLARLLTHDVELAQPHFVDQLKLCVGIDVFRPMAGEGLAGLGAICAAVGRAADAARLSGAARMLGYPDPSDRAIYDRLEADYFAPARANYGDQAWSDSERTGEALSYAEALNYAINEVGVTILTATPGRYRGTPQVCRSRMASASHVASSSQESTGVSGRTTNLDRPAST